MIAAVVFLVIVLVIAGWLFHLIDKITPPITVVQPPVKKEVEVVDTSNYDYRMLVARSQDQYIKEVEYPRTILQESLIGYSPVEWYRGVDTEPSPAEQLIIDELVKYKIEWHREVCFKKLVLPTGGMARMDFYLPRYKTVIEYNSKQWHSTEDRIAVDNIKKQFCLVNKLDLVVYTNKDYYNLHHRIKELMVRLKVI